MKVKLENDMTLFSIDAIDSGKKESTNLLSEVKLKTF